MDNFESCLVLKTNSSQELKLNNTKKLIRTKFTFTTYQSKYLYTINNFILEIFTFTNSKIFEKKLKFNFYEILCIQDDFYGLYENKLIKNNDKFVEICGKNCKLVNIENNIGIQNNNDLVVYDKNLDIKQTYKCNVSCYIDDVLITGLNNLLTVYIKLNKKIEIYLEEEISCVATNMLFSAIYCGSPSGKIYLVNLNNTKNIVMDYHDTKVTFLKMSFCNRFLFSVDEKGEILCWDCRHNVVCDRTVLEDKIEDIQVVLIGNLGVLDKIPIRDF